MRNLLFIVLAATLFLASCKKNTDDTPAVMAVTVQLVYPTSSQFAAKEGVTVKMNSAVSSYEATTDATGKAAFNVPVGVYEASATDTRSANGSSFVYNGVQAAVSITGNWAATDVVTLNLTQSKSSQIIIKEVYTGATPLDDGSGSFAYDKYVILYNNSETVANLGNMCIANIAPYNSQATNPYANTAGALSYEAEGWIPAGQAYWYFQQDIAIEPGKQIVVAINAAVNHTTTYSKSVNFDNPAYYAMYDIAKFSHAASYPAPAASIPTNHYLKAATYAAGTAWAISVTSPGMFLFTPSGITPAALETATAEYGSAIGGYTSRKIPVSWIVDGVETFLMNNTSNKKRFTASVDAGYVYHLNRQGYSVYRNVDKAKTEAFAGNTGKLVYSYALGTTAVGGTTDPSGIDAEASIKAGARIFYSDVNNSTTDFHLRSKGSLNN